MDDAARLAEALALLREAKAQWLDLQVGSNWWTRADTLLAPSPDPDAVAKEIALCFTRGAYPLVTDMTKESEWRGRYSDPQQNGFRAVAAWHTTEMAKARNAALREAAGEARNARDEAAILALIKDPPA